MRSLRRILPALAIALAAIPLAADPIDFSGSLRLRAEAWNWFETPGFDDDYVFFASLLRASATQTRGRLSWRIELAQPTLLNLPDDAVAPAPRGQLGLGATYFAANGRVETVAELFAKQAWLRLERGGAALRLGRFEFADGAEVASQNPILGRLERERVAQRLIGPFGFSHVGRSFDGVHATWARAPLRATLVAARPTTGAFRADGGSRLDEVTFAYGSLARAEPAASMRLFAIVYRDERGVVKTDNRPAAARAADRGDVAVTTLGGHYLRLLGDYDFLAWGAVQGGDWGSLDHEALALAIEGGRHWTRGSLRAGAWIGSGDDDPADGEHGTFFQLLPTPRLYARFPFYNAMNSRDVFVAGSLQATPSLRVTSELHRLRLDSGADLWYAGGGAFEESTFGFAGRPAGGSRDLAATLDLGAELALSRKTALAFYAGAARGGEVVDSIFAGSTARFLYLELTRTF